MKESLISIRSSKNTPKLKRAICCLWMSLIPSEKIDLPPSLLWRSLTEVSTFLLWLGMAESPRFIHKPHQIFTLKISQPLCCKWSSSVLQQSWIQIQFSHLQTVYFRREHWYNLAQMFCILFWTMAAGGFSVALCAADSAATLTETDDCCWEWSHMRVINQARLPLRHFNKISIEWQIYSNITAL